MLIDAVLVDLALDLAHWEPDEIVMHCLQCDQQVEHCNFPSYSWFSLSFDDRNQFEGPVCYEHAESWRAYAEGSLVPLGAGDWPGD
jgi:hypothetical protein